MDSRNIISQMNKENNTNIKEYFLIKEKILENNSKKDIIKTQIKRKRNKDADKLANMGVDKNEIDQENMEDKQYIINDKC